MDAKFNKIPLEWQHGAVQGTVTERCNQVTGKPLLEAYGLSIVTINSAKHPSILEVAVIDVPNEASGDSVKAFVVKKDPILQASDIIHFCRDYLK